MIAALDTDKSTRDATENCFKITNLIRKDNIKPRSVKKGLARIEIAFNDIKKANQCVSVVNSHKIVEEVVYDFM